MLTLVIKLLLFLFGVLLLGEKTTPFISVLSFLCALSLTALNQYFANRTFTIIGASVYFCAIVFYPNLYSFLPLIFFDLLQVKGYKFAPFVFLPLIIHWSEWDFYIQASVVLITLFAVVMQYMCVKLMNLIEENRLIRDNSTELNLILQQKNKYLREKHDSDIHLATLKERNRIAREIHDNVGHILSRSILQMGAVQAVNKDEKLVMPLTSLQETLILAMDSIRGSVHDLRDDSVDLHATLMKILEPINFEIDLDYDISGSVPNNVKYAFLGVLKEATTNTIKHSDATSIHIVLREHPGLYQLLIHDNGTKEPKMAEKGMGLTNMEERVTALNGQFDISYQKGFRVFISIPKEEVNK